MAYSRTTLHTFHDTLRGESALDLLQLHDDLGAVLDPLSLRDGEVTAPGACGWNAGEFRSYVNLRLNHRGS